MKKQLKKFWEYLQGLRFENRCPNCNGSFFKKGEGGLIAAECEDQNGRACSMEINFCIECLEHPALLNTKTIEAALRRWDCDEDIVECSMLAVKKFLNGKITYSIWRKKSE